MAEGKTKLTLINVVVRETRDVALFIEAPLEDAISEKVIESKLIEFYNGKLPANFSWWVKGSREGSFLE
jgi:hypothetical protein